MFGKLGVWSLCVIALVGVIGFAKTSADLRDAREVAQVQTMTYAARQELRQALSERDLVQEQANAARLQAAEMLREAEKVEASAASILEAASRRDSLRLEEAKHAAALAAKQDEIEKGEILRQNADVMLEQMVAERNAAQEEVREARQQVTFLQRESQGLAAGVAERQQEAESRLASIERQVEELDAQRGDLEEAVARLRSDHAGLTLDVEKATKRHDELIAENDNLAAALVARSSERNFAPSRSMAEIDREAKRLEDASTGFTNAEPESVESTVDVDWAALGAIPLPPPRPRTLRSAEPESPTQDVAPRQARRSAAVAAPPRAVAERPANSQRSERASSASVSPTAQSGTATLSLPSALLPETPAIGVR